MVEFLDQLKQTGALDIADPAKAYQNALATKATQTNIKTAELSQEQKMMDITKGYLQRVTGAEDYQRLKGYLTETLGSRFNALPDLKTDAQVKEYIPSAISSFDEAAKMMRGAPYKIYNKNTGAVVPIRNKEQEEELYANGTLKREEYARGSQAWKPAPKKTTQKTIYGPNEKTELVSVESGEDYMPPEGWSLAEPETEKTPTNAMAAYIKKNPKASNEELATFAQKLKAPGTPKYAKIKQADGQEAFIEEGQPLPDGASFIRGGVTVNVGGKPAPSSERTKIAELLAFKSQLGRIGDLYEKGFVGRLQGQVGALKEIVGMGVKEKEVVFRQVVKDIADTLLRLKSGAQINEEEYKRLTKLVPGTNLPDEVFLGRLQALETTIDETVKIRQRLLAESGFRTTGGAAPGGGTTLKFDAEGNQIQ